MSIKQIMKSDAIICSVPDERKAEAVKKTIQGEIGPDIPASILRESKTCYLYLDFGSSKLLDKSPLV